MKFINNRTIKSAAWYTASSMIAKAITLLITPVFTRLLSKSEYGDYTNFVSWQNILITVFSLELSSTVLRAKFDRAKELSFNSYVYTISWFSIAITAFLSLVLGLLNRIPTIQNIIGIKQVNILALSLIIIFIPILQIFQAQQRAKLNYVSSSIITIFYGICSFVVPYILVKISNAGVNSLFRGLALNSSIFGIFLLAYISTRKKDKPDFTDIKYALVFSLPVVPHLVSSIIMGNSDKIMIKNMCGSDFAAIYGLVYTCALAINLLRNSLNNAWLPWFYGKMNEANYSRINHISRIYIIIFSLGSVLVCLLGPEVVMILGGEQYKEALLLLPVIMLGCYYNFLNLFYVNIEFYAKKTGMISIITACTALLNLILNYVCITNYGYKAAAYTTAVCNLLIVVLHFVVTRKLNNKEVCDNKLIFVLSFFSPILVVICIIAYKFLFIRIALILVFVFLSTLYSFKLKKSGFSVRSNNI